MDSTLGKWIALVVAVLAVVVPLCWWCYQMGRDDKMDTIGHLQAVNGDLDNDLKSCQERVGQLAPPPTLEPAGDFLEPDEAPGGDPAAAGEEWASAYNIEASVTQELALNPEVTLAVRRIYRKDDQQMAELEVRTPTGVDSGALARGETATIGGIRVRLVELSATQASLFVDLGAS